MLLGHRAGVPDWDSPAVDEQVGRHPARIWKISDFLDLAAAKPPLFAPGTSFSYSNTDYTLLGLIIQRVTGHSWRREVTRRVIRPLRLTRTHVPAPGQRSVKGPHAHGYVELDGRLTDVKIDPSFRRPRRRLRTRDHRPRPRALPGRAIRRPAVPPPRDAEAHAAHAPAQGEGGLVGYGLGIERRALPGGAELIGHLGGAVFRTYVGRLHPTGVTIALAMNVKDDPTPLLLPAVNALIAARR